MMLTLLRLVIYFVHGYEWHRIEAVAQSIEVKPFPSSGMTLTKCDGTVDH